MAKIPRYIAGQTNVGMLEQGRRAVIGPQEAAAAAGAKYSAISQITDIGMQTVVEYDKVKQANQKADDKLALTRQSLLTSTLIDKAYNDAAENNSTADELEENLKDVLDSSDAVLSELQHPDNIRDMPKNMALAKAGMWEDNRSRIRDYGIARTTAEFNGQWEAAFQAKDTITLSHLLTFAGDPESGIKNPEEMSKMTTEFESLVMQEDAQKVASKVEMAYISGEKEGEQAYDDLVSNTDMDADTKKMALIMAGVHRANFMRSQIDDKARENVMAIQHVTVNSENAKNGNFGHDENSLALANRNYGVPDSVSAITRWASVYRNIEQRKRSNTALIDVSSAVATGTILPPTDKNRKALDSYVSSHVEATGMEVDGDEYFRFIADISQGVGVLPQREREGINSGLVSQDMAERFLPLWDYIKDNNALSPDLGLTDKANTMYASISSLTTYGTPADTAIQLIYDTRDLKPADKEALILDYEEEESPKDAFGDVTSSDYFDIADPWFASIDTQTKMRTRYDAVRLEVYKATNGNITVANDVADQAVKNTWGPSNFGNAPDMYTVQEDPLGYDMSEFQHQLINKLNGQNITFNVYDPDSGHSKVKFLEEENISFFRVPQQEGEGRDGVRRYQVLYNGKPVVNMDTGMVVDFPITSAEAKEISRRSEIRTQRSDEVHRVTDRIAEIEESIKDIKEKGSLADFGITNRSGLGVEFLEKELAGLKRQLPETKTRRDSVLYSPYPEFATGGE